MAIIDKTYFIGEISVPNNDDMNDQLDIFIDRTEFEVLNYLLGAELYADYVANPTDARWVALVEGETFTYLDYTIIWKGLKNTELVSLLAYFTYEKLLRSNSSTFTSIGTTKGNSEKAEKTSEAFKMSFAQNRAIDLYGDVSIEGIPRDKVYKPTAYNFLRYNEAYDWTGWIFTPIQRINQFGI